jgi:hypothetical protein
MTSSRVTLAGTVACLVALALPSLSHAQKKVPGEKWRQTISMEASGMKLPARTLEVCVPVGKAEEALARPPENNDCKLSDVQRSGNKFSANIQCAGKTPMEGRIEQTSEGNRTIGKMQMKMQGMSMNMNFDSTKLGTACEATDYSDYKPPATGAVPNISAPDVCAQMGESVKSSPGELAGTLAYFVDKNAQCAKHASFKSYCSAVQTPAGFAGLAKQERSMAGTADRTSPFVIPLTTSVQACGLGTGKPGIDALRTRLLATAEKEGAWDFLVQEGDDATYAMLAATAKRECSGRSFTNAANARYSGLCRNYGVALARGDVEAVRSAAGIDSSPGGSAQPAADAGDDAQSQGKARDALNKGKQKLRNIFGGG